MSKVLDFCVELIANRLSIPKAEAAKHAFALHCVELERRSQHARLAYPAIYLVLGLILGLLLLNIDPTQSDRWNKVFGAVVGVFSALLAFWKPAVVLRQADCERLFVRLSGTDIAELNQLLALPTKGFDNTVKLISAVCSFAAIYLLTGK